VGRVEHRQDRAVGSHVEGGSHDPPRRYVAGCVNQQVLFDSHLWPATFQLNDVAFHKTRHGF
jgi:hypothetical protein